MFKYLRKNTKFSPFLLYRPKHVKCKPTQLAGQKSSGLSRERHGPSLWLGCRTVDFLSKADIGQGAWSGTCWNGIGTTLRGDLGGCRALGGGSGGCHAPGGGLGGCLALWVGVWGVPYPGRRSGVPCPSYGHGLLVALLLPGGLRCDKEALCALQVLDSVLFPQSPHRLPSCSGPASCPDTSPCASAPSSLPCQGPGSATVAWCGQALPVL